MTMVSSRSGTVCLLLFIVLAGCNQNRVNPIVFSQAIFDASQKLGDEHSKIFADMQEAVDEEPGSIEKLEVEYAKLKKVLSELDAELPNLKIPDDASSKTLYSAYQKFLQGQSSMASNEIDQMIKCIKDKHSPRNERASKYLQLANAVAHKTQSDGSLVDAAHRTFDSEHHLDINNK